MGRHSRRERDAGLRRITSLTRTAIVGGLVVTGAATGAAAAGLSSITIRTSTTPTGTSTNAAQSSSDASTIYSAGGTGVVPSNNGATDPGVGSNDTSNSASNNTSNDPSLQTPSAPPDFGGNGGGAITQSGGS